MTYWNRHQQEQRDLIVAALAELDRLERLLLRRVGLRAA